MKLKLLKCGEVKEFNDSYAARLIEQGKAVLPSEEPKEKTADPAKKAAQTKKETDSKTTQKG